MKGTSVSGAFVESLRHLQGFQGGLENQGNQYYPKESERVRHD